ncbi:hypothetical protein HELRODRAFT_170285 [Helobdella robusta]|uniref:Uncharacterized protein n=1 Tax=Helobdella robusta TaxID=6412 RepID=T1F2V7_HELRO|nr:hypothetical protein HELRODRAFT_170285 [Helobdella robusta]ESO07739.1 hypothetical protein HELRODRAFT_170285 [Helobdella robusta]
MEDTVKLKSLLAEFILNSCGNTFKYSDELNVQCLIGVTVDNKNVFLININESNSKCNLNNNNNNNINNNNSLLVNINATNSSCTSNTKSDQALPKVVSERRHTECVAIDHDGGGYAEVQKCMKIVQHPTGLVEQKEVQWKTYSVDGKLLEEKKVEEIQPVDETQTIPGNDAETEEYMPNDAANYDQEQNYNEYYEEYTEDQLYDAVNDNQYYYPYGEQQQLQQQQQMFCGPTGAGGKGGTLKRGRGRGQHSNVTNKQKIQQQSMAQKQHQQHSSGQPPFKKFHGANSKQNLQMRNYQQTKQTNATRKQSQQFQQQQQQSHFQQTSTFTHPQQQFHPRQQQQRKPAPQQTFQNSPRFQQQHHQQQFHLQQQSSKLNQQQHQQQMKPPRVRKVTYKQNPTLVNKAVKMVHEGAITIKDALKKFNLSRVDFSKCLKMSSSANDAEEEEEAEEVAEDEEEEWDEEGNDMSNYEEY